jgi:very-short-patch-repair endonuclease
MRVPEIITNAARNLRKNMTKSEIELWSHIKNKSIWVRFMRQKPIYVYTENSWLDRFIIADVYCSEKNLVIELDWWIHLEKEVLELDREKEKLLENKWIKVIRFKNEEIFNDIRWVLEKIKNHI